MGRRQAGLTAVEVLVVIVVTLMVLALLLPAMDGRGGRSRARNGSTRATLEDLQKAFEAYKADYSTYPCKVGGGLSADTRLFVECLRRPSGPKAIPYYAFKPDDFVNGEFLSPHGKPYYYTFPAKDVPGPDGKAHPGVDYYLWTWGCFTDPPDADWEINNWTRP